MADAWLGLLLIALGCALPVLAAWAIAWHRQRREARASLTDAPRTANTDESQR